MKAVILAGGYGSRLAEETKVKPKPLVMVGNKPIIWHIIQIYNHYDIKDFIICLGYKGHLLKKELNKLNYKIPNYCHIPLALDRNKEKIGKSSGAKEIDNRNPKTNLIDGFHLLNLKPPEELYDCNISNIWNWGIQNWNRNKIKDEGGGEFRILENGKIFERVGVNFSEVYGKFSHKF